jgi:hypothetical protein
MSGAGNLLCRSIFRDTVAAAAGITGGARMSRPVFVSDEMERKVLAWLDMIQRLKEMYSVEHLPFAGPPRTLARGKAIWMRALTAAARAAE